MSSLKQLNEESPILQSYISWNDVELQRPKGDSYYMVIMDLHCSAYKRLQFTLAPPWKSYRTKKPSSISNFITYMNWLSMPISRPHGEHSLGQSQLPYWRTPIKVSCKCHHGEIPSPVRVRPIVGNDEAEIFQTPNRNSVAPCRELQEVFLLRFAHLMHH